MAPILSFASARARMGYVRNYLIVRYEDLWNKPEEELRRIFAVVGLDADKYDFNAAINLPVRGSSTFHGKEEQRYHWKPVEKTADFDPLARASHWSRSMHERFDWIAGEKLASLGYMTKRLQRKKIILGGLEQNIGFMVAVKRAVSIHNKARKGCFEMDLRSRQDVEIPPSGAGFHKDHFQSTKSAFKLNHSKSGQQKVDPAKIAKKAQLSSFRIPRNMNNSGLVVS